VNRFLLKTVGPAKMSAEGRSLSTANPGGRVRLRRAALLLGLAGLWAISAAAFQAAFPDNPSREVTTV